MEVTIPRKSVKTSKKSPNISEDQLEKARALYVKSRVYHMVAIGLVFTGLLTMTLVYNDMSGGNFAILFEHPKTIFILVLPFLPACIVSMMATDMRKKCEKIVSEKKLNMQTVAKAKKPRK